MQLQTLDITSHTNPNQCNWQSSSVHVDCLGNGENHKITCPNCNEDILLAWRMFKGYQIPTPEEVGGSTASIYINPNILEEMMRGNEE
jgi:hypothetical protein